MSEPKSHTADYKASNAIIAYQDAKNRIGYETINRFLRHHQLPDGRPGILLDSADPLYRRIGTVVESLDGYMKPGKKAEDGQVVYRGVSKSFAMMLNMINHSYTSVSTDIEVAKAYGEVVLKISLPKSIKRHIMARNYEKELLLERNTIIRVLGDRSSVRMHAEIPCEIVKIEPEARMKQKEESYDDRRTEYIQRLLQSEASPTFSDLSV